MSKEDSSSGLLSKVVKFVRNPATNWSDLDNKETDRDEALSKQLLKEMIERKRRNDFVRKREFDMLRKMRMREALVGQDMTARPSFFQSSMPSKPDDRAQTLKKIDEIEAQMSMQWWKTKHGNSTIGAVGMPPAPVGRAHEVRERQPDSLPFAANAMPVGYAATEPSGLRLPAEKASGGVPLFSPAGAVASGAAQEAPASTMPVRMMALEIEEVAHDAELEEASIRFANGDDAGAEAGLLEMLAPGGSRVGHPDTWMALFDLYRATGQQDKFEAAAIEFVQRFDRSAPQWYSLPEIVKKLAAPEGKPASSNPGADWICPSVLGIQTVAALKAAIAKAPMPWRLDWSNLKSIEAAAVEPLYRVFNSWSAQPVQLRFMGDAQLRQVLQKATPSGQRETPQVWWQLRMEALRATHRPDEFELAALDFCVTYEVSPPAWESARCDYKPLAADGGSIAGRTIIGDVYRDSVHSSISVMDGDTHIDAMSSLMGNVYSVELSGQIQGDAIEVLDQLEAKLMGGDIMVISCAKLIRVDFSAAGTLLNWVSARQAENRAVQFSEVNRLVAAFFNVIGITEHARVTCRID